MKAVGGQVMWTTGESAAGGGKGLGGWNRTSREDQQEESDSRARREGGAGGDGVQEVVETGHGGPQASGAWGLVMPQEMVSHLGVSRFSYKG